MEEPEQSEEPEEERAEDCAWQVCGVAEWQTGWGSWRVSMRVVYRDPRTGHTYSAPIFQQGNQWMMQTNEGLTKIEYVFRDDNAGTLFFDSYREDQPTPPAEPDTRLHVEPGNNSFAQLQDAGARAAAEYETQRQRERREILDALNQPNTRKIAEARAHSTALAQRWSPKTPGVLPPTQLTQEYMTDEQARRRKLTLNRMELEEAGWRKKKKDA